MATYILLLTLYPEGRERILDNPNLLLEAEDAIDVDDVACLGIYGVLGQYDFVALLEAPDNEAVARFSLELGVRAGVHVETLPAVPIALLDRPRGAESKPAAEEVPLD